jgi:hypothetical protein
MNGTEQEYARLLEVRHRAGELLWYRYEPVKLRLADRTYYTPDFLVVANDMTLELHEVKHARAGQRTYYTDDSRVKIKVAAEQYPMFSFVGVTKRAKSDGGGWSEERFA